MAAPRCLHCGYILTGLQDARCPECGTDFNLDDPSTYTTKPLFDRYRFWLPGFLLALTIGVIFFPLLIYFAGFGVTVTLVLPVCLGTIIGFGCRVSKFNRALLILTIVAGVVIALFSLHIVGIFCGLILGAVVFGPFMVGTFLGYLLRLQLKNSSWEQRWHLPILLLLLALVISATLESRYAAPYPDETITTSIVLPEPIDRAWDSLMFYEEVHGTPPLLLRLALPRPLYARGSTQHVGDLKVCVYTKGRLVKRVVQREPNSLLAFDVVEQTRIEDRSIAHKSGSFEFTAVTADQTRVTLSSTYRPLLGPRWAWRWSEKIGFHTLHKYVLEGMRLKSEADIHRPNRAALGVST